MSTPRKRQRPVGVASAQSDVAGTHHRNVADLNAQGESREFDVVAIKPNGKRIVAGTCPTREAAESWVALLTKYGRLVGTRAYVEEREARPWPAGS